MAGPDEARPGRDTTGSGVSGPETPLPGIATPDGRAPESGVPDVAGLVPLSSVDYPGGLLAAVVFVRGCAWACPYCQNAELRRFGPGERSWAGVLDWLKTRQGLLDAAVFSGGEPTLWPRLARAAQEVRALGFRAGLHTAGMAPESLARALPHLDWVGLDIKAPQAAYARLSGHSESAAAAWESLELLRNSGVDFELRTTWHPAVLSEDELLDLARELAPLGTGRWVLQAFQPQGCADESLAAAGRASLPADLPERLRAVLGPGIELNVRE